MTTTIQIRIDQKTKRAAEKTFKKMGLDTSSGIKLYLHQVIKSHSIPFTIRTANGFTPAQEKK
jgi:DNA-damage-inducible protein J